MERDVCTATEVWLLLLSLVQFDRAYVLMLTREVRFLALNAAIGLAAARPARNAMENSCVRKGQMVNQLEKRRRYLRIHGRSFATAFFLVFSQGHIDGSQTYMYSIIQ